MADDRGAAFLRMIRELDARHLVGIAGVSEVWLIRHADAYAGLLSIDEGLVDPPLSEQGREQAALLAARLAPVELDAVWSSDLRRARETADAIAGPRPLEVRVDARLREARTHWDEGSREVRTQPGEYPFPEPFPEVVERMRAVVADVVAELEGAGGEPARAAVVSHNAAINLYVAAELGLSWGQLRLLPQFTSVSVLAVKGDRTVVRSIADATHLAARLAPA